MSVGVSRNFTTGIRSGASLTYAVWRHAVGPAKAHRVLRATRVRAFPCFVAALALALVTACTCPAAMAHVGSLPERPLFEFHSDPWVNLHQHLAAEAGLGWWRGNAPACACAKGEDGTVRLEWSAAVESYRSGLKDRDPTFDEGLQRTNLLLGLTGDAPSLPAQGVDATIARVLPPLYASYLQRGWPEDDAKNRAWLSVVKPLLDRWGPGIAAELAQRFDTSWPAAPVRVEISRLAGAHGAYTSTPPILTTMSSDDARYQGEAALEMLFHEASHGLSGNLEHDLDMAFTARGQEAPRELEHVLIFYTAGELVRRRLGPTYVPYGYKQGVYERGDWPRLEAAVRASWQPWLAGETSLQDAIARLADALVMR